MIDDAVFALAELAAATLIVVLLAVPLYSSAQQVARVNTQQVVNESIEELSRNGSIAVIYTSIPVAAPWGSATCIEIVGGELEPCGA